MFVVVGVLLYYYALIIVREALIKRTYEFACIINTLKLLMYNVLVEDYQTKQLEKCFADFQFK